MQSKCKSLVDNVTSLKEKLNSLDQHGGRKNIVLSGIPECVTDNALEACHRFGKPERTTKSRKTIVKFTNRKYCKKALLNRQKLDYLDNEKKQLDSSNKIFVRENLS